MAAAAAAAPEEPSEAGQIKQRIEASVAAEITAIEACSSSAHAFLRGYELGQAGATEPEINAAIQEISNGDAQKAAALLPTALLGAKLDRKISIGRGAIELRESCLREQAGGELLTAGVQAVVQATQAANARVSCLSALAYTDREVSASELQFLGCLPRNAYPGLPKSLGGGELYTTIKKTDGGAILHVEGVLEGNWATPACLNINSTPPFKKNYQTRCKIVGNVPVLSLAAKLSPDEDADAGIDAATQAILKNYLADPKAAESE